MSGVVFIQPDLCSIRVAAEQAESADAIPDPHGADDCTLVRDDPLAALARDNACTVTKAGVLHASGCSDRQRGTTGACPVISCRGHRTGAGR